MMHLNVGDKAPKFKGQIQDGTVVSNENYLGKKLILFIYPKDNTPGCNNENCNLRDNYVVLKEKGFELLGLSADSKEKHTKFREKYELPFDLIADEDKEVLNAFGVWGLKKFMGKEYDGIHRTTFIINEEGIITNIYKKVKTKEHAEQILADFE